jgi:hypothetical protein
MIAHIAVCGSPATSRRRRAGAEVVVERTDDQFEQPQQASPTVTTDGVNGKKKTLRSVFERAAIEGQRQRHRDDQHRQCAGQRVEGGVRGDLGRSPRSARCSWRPTNCSVARPRRVGERRPQAFQQRIEAEAANSNSPGARNR